MATSSTKRPITAARPAGRRRRFVSCFSAGKRHHMTPVGPYTFCPSPNQRSVLFADENPVKIGCGVFGCAFDYPRDPNKVVKVTVDRADVSALVAATEENVPHVVRIFDAWKLAQPVVSKGMKNAAYQWTPSGWTVKPGERFPAWAMIVERVSPIPKEDRRWVGRVLAGVSMTVRERGRAPTTEELVEQCPRVKDKRQRCERFAAEASDTAHKLLDLGVEWRDAHVGNVGVDANGDWKVLDLGLSKHTWSTPDQELAGRRRTIGRARGLRRIR